MWRVRPSGVCSYDLHRFALHLAYPALRPSPRVVLAGPSGFQAVLAGRNFDPSVGRLIGAFTIAAGPAREDARLTEPECVRDAADAAGRVDQHDVEPYPGLPPAGIGGQCGLTGCQ